MFYRAAKCKTCRVKCGMGDCPECMRMREALVSLEAAVIAQFGKAQASDAQVEVMEMEPEESDRDGFRERRRCPTCYDDATAFNVSQCPTCLGEGWIEE